ncbi:oligosaccharide flippase family protein [Candidatus Micrarchaeota archaeon]|nr:oligosaccharide flippase family protein [Candidatus Micrarchaeota archaeon]
MLDRIRKSTYWLTLVAVTGMVASMGLGYLYHFAVTRLLSPGEYGELGILLGILTIVTVPIATLSAILTREVAKLDAVGKEEKINHVIKRFLFHKNVAVFLVATLIATATVFLLLPKKVSLAACLLILGFSVLATYLSGIVSSYFQGRERIGKLSVINTASPLFKLVFAVVIVLLLKDQGLGLFGALAAIPLGSLVVIFPILFLLWGKKEEEQGISFKKSFFLILAANVLFAIFLYLDLFSVGYYLGSENAGYYNVASITAKVVFFIAGGVAIVLFPKTSKMSYAKNKQRIKELLGKSILFLIPVFVVFVFFPQFVITTFYTEKYLPAATPFFILSFGMLFMGVFQLLLTVMWSQNQEVFPLFILGASLGIYFVLLNTLVPRYSLAGAAASMVAASLFLAGGSLLKVFRHVKE